MVADSAYKTKFHLSRTLQSGPTTPTLAETAAARADSARNPAAGGFYAFPIFCFPPETTTLSLPFRR